jgi:hypothetical protein
MNEDNQLDKMLIMLDNNDDQLRLEQHVESKNFFYHLLFVNQPYQNRDILNLIIEYPLKKKEMKEFI